ncbi:hypothetical protein AQUCO_07500019v1 [Aquilegia coerulea]|uniref:Uncharacterized protein n=1 Tax=Aquilegia coerulea TaxID=218851 RepID=A0A2G5C945_AQUCA|nr:hypothetical protein AQUCO_07500019v1 [Aquilegia coerulea]
MLHCQVQQKGNGSIPLEDLKQFKTTLFFLNIHLFNKTHSRLDSRYSQHKWGLTVVILTSKVRKGNSCTLLFLCSFLCTGEVLPRPPPLLVYHRGKHILAV